jgi:cytoskeletal protein CcmA (bactofilin family)
MRWLPAKTRAEQGRSEEMLQPAQNQSNAQKFSTTPTPYTPPKTFTQPLEQATIGRSVVIKGEISGAEALYIDGRVEGSIHLADNRVTIGRNGSVAANINAKEVVIMGEVKGNVECSDRLDIRSEGSLVGDVVTRRISVEDGAVMKGSVQVKAEHEKKKSEVENQPKAASPEPEKPKVAAAAAATGGSATPMPGSQVLYKGSN